MARANVSWFRRNVAGKKGSSSAPISFVHWGGVWFWHVANNSASEAAIASRQASFSFWAAKGAPVGFGACHILHQTAETQAVSLHTRGFGKLFNRIHKSNSHKSRKAYCAVNSSPGTRYGSRRCQISSLLCPLVISCMRRRASEISRSSRQAESFIASNCSSEGAAGFDARGTEQNGTITDANKIPFRASHLTNLRAESFSSATCFASARTRARFFRRKDDSIHIPCGSGAPDNLRP